MMIRVSSFVALFFVFCAAAQALAPRLGTEGVAAAIEANYFDPTRGKAIAADLRAAAVQGEFDHLTDPRDLAATLSARLAPLDGHFNVTWEDTPSATTDPSPIPDFDTLERRSNYGIRRVEVEPGNVGYLNLHQFSALEFGQLEQPARRAIDSALQLLSGADAVIIDLRENGGGSPHMVGYLVSAFTPRGADIFNTFHSPEGKRSEAPQDWYSNPRLDVPLFLLISGRTASAGEAFAYTLQSAKRAVVLGEASAGAANPGELVDAGNGLRVFVSFATPINPITQANWEGDGVRPDVKVAVDLALQQARQLALEAIIKREPGPGSTEARWTLEALRATTRPPQVTPDDYVGDYGPVQILSRDGGLILKQDRRPLRALLPHGNDLFSVEGDPTRRVLFERTREGRPIALEIQMPQRPPRRFLR